MFGALQGAAHADGFTWTGATSSDWNTGGNWTKTGASARVFPNDVTDTATFPTPITANKTPTISTSVTVNKLTFNEDGYEVASAAGQTLTLGGTAPTVAVGSSATALATISASLSGALTKGGTGILILNGTNTFTTPTISYVQGANSSAAIDDGAIRLSSNGALGGITTINAPTTNTGIQRLELSGNISLGTGVNINTSGRSNGVRANSIIVNVSGNNTFNGSITISNGGGGYNIYSDTAGDTLTLGPLTSTFNNGNTRTFNMAGAGDIVVNGVISNNATSTTLIAISKPGSGTPGTGKLTLAGDNTYTGGTTVGTGILQVGNGGNSGTLGTGAVTVTDALVVNRTGTVVVPGVLSGAGTVTVNVGTLQVGSVNTTPFPSLTVNNGGGFTFVPSTLTAATQTFTLSNLTLTDGSTIGTGLGNTPATSAVINVTNAAKVNGTITVKPFAIAGATPTNGNYSQVTDSTGGLLNTNTSTATYVAASGVSNTSFTVVATDTEVRVTGVAAAPAPVLYWKGGQVAGAGNSWSATSGAITNWTTDAAGTNVSPVVPTSITDVFISAAGATLQDQMVLGTNFSIKSLTVTDSNPVLLGSGNTLSIDTAGTTINAGAGTVTLNAVLDGAGSISKNSAADMTLGAANTYTGPVTVGAGVLNIRNATGLGTTAAGTSVSNGGTLQVQGGLAVAEPLNLNGVGATGQNGALVSLSGTNSSSAGITLGSNATVSNDSGGTFTLSGAIFGPTFTVTLNNAGVGSGLVSGIIGTTTGGVTKTGAGSWQFTNVNTYTGPTTVQAGLLDLKRTTQTAIASGSAVTVADGATIQITDHAGGGQSDYANPLTLNGIGNGTNGALNFVNSGAFAMTGPITLASDSVVRTDVAGQTASSLITFSNAVSGAGGLTLLAGGTTANGTPQFAFTGANTYNGSTLITSNGSGTAPFQVIVSGASDRLPTTTNVRLGGTPTGLTGAFNSNVALSLNGVNQTVAGLQVTTGATGTYNVAGNSTTLSTLTVNNSAADTFSGNLGGAGTNNNNLALSKTGSGRLTLTGTDTYTGGTSATGGSLSGSGALGGVTNFATGATHAPGVAGPGIQAVNGNYTLASGSNLVSDIGGTTVGTEYDQVNVTGTVTLGGKLQVTLPAAYTPTVGNAFTIVSNDGSDAVASTFSGLPQGALVNSADGRATFTISYTGGDGNDVTLTNSSVRGAGSSAVLVSQFRLSGPAGSTDEFIELYNNTNAPLNVDGWQLKAGAATQTFAAQTASATQTGSTLIPARGHVLITGGAYSLGGYSLSDLPSTLGDIDPATPLTLVNAGGTTVDTVNNGGALTPDAARVGEQYALVRRFETGLPTGGDSNFNLVSLGQTATNSDGTGTAPFVNTGRLGAPGPRNSQSPVQNNNQAPLTNPAGIANQTAKYISSSGNYNGAAAALSPGGQISIRRTVTNNTPATATRLRFRLAALTAGTSPTAGVADLRAISSKSALLNITGVTVNGLTLEAPSSQTGTGGGLNSSWVTVDLSTTALTLTDNTTATGGLPAGKAANFEFLFGITSPGNYKAVVDVELLP